MYQSPWLDKSAKQTPTWLKPTLFQNIKGYFKTGAGILLLLSLGCLVFAAIIGPIVIVLHFVLKYW